MAWTLGSITLPTPQRLKREQINIEVEHMTLDGTSKKDIAARKERYVLGFDMLTQVEFASMKGEWDLQTARNFAVSDGSLTISSTPVHIQINERTYNTPGDQFREDIDLILTEVN